MSITITCPHCAAKGNVPDTMVGQNVRCPKCKKTFLIEAPPEEPVRSNVRATAPQSAPPPASSFDFGTDAPAPAPSATEDAGLPDPYAERDQEIHAEESEEAEGRTVRRSASSGQGGGFVDFLLFRKMITPTIVLALFYIVAGLGCLGTIASAALSIFSGNVGLILMSVIGGFFGYIFFILMARIWCELILVIFRHYETAVDILDELRKQRK